MTKVAGKVWGATRQIFANDNAEVHRIHVLKGGECSKHRHVHKWNAFFVERGEIHIDVWKNSYDLIDRTVLKTGDYMEVPPGEYHRFQAVDDSVVYEIYWVDLDPNDIERETVGSLETARA